MSRCPLQASGETVGGDGVRTIVLFFYGELAPAAHAEVEAHLPGCRDCRDALDELRMIRDALASRPEVSAPPGGDWSGFMQRLDAATARTPLVSTTTTPASRVRRSYIEYLAMAAVLALVVTSVLFLARSRIDRGSSLESPETSSVRADADTEPAGAFAALSEEHFERSKLVVLGLSTKDSDAAAIDWTFERDLASNLLDDTRTYRLAAEDRGLRAVADVMRDLELVLLQTSMTDSADPAALGRLQRLIQKRDLLEKMNVVATTGL